MGVEWPHIIIEICHRNQCVLNLKGWIKSQLNSKQGQISESKMSITTFKYYGQDYWNCGNVLDEYLQCYWIFKKAWESNYGETPWHSLCKISSLFVSCALITKRRKLLMSIAALLEFSVNTHYSAVEWFNNIIEIGHRNQCVLNLRVNWI